MKEKGDAAAPTLDAVIGKKLISIDGSLIALDASEGGLSREIVGSNGAVQKTALRFINDRLGTVTDVRDANKVTGVFRMTGGNIEIQYADGVTETLLANASGGISIESRQGAGQPYCTAWYPEGHVFSLDDRKAALAQYASRLGLPDSGDKSAQPRIGCGPAQAALLTDAHVKPESPMPEAAVHAPVPTVSPAAANVRTKTESTVAALPTAVAASPAVLASAGVTAKTVAPKTSDVAAAAGHAIDVRTSEVHPIDAVPPAEPQPPQMVASLGPNQSPAMPAQRGASSCLSVDSDGSHWGFRNHCGYTVQFAYCLMNGNALASCRDGAVAGSVAGNGFGALAADESLKESDAAHDFRWVACQGGAGEVIPRLDQTEPPSGRCVR